LATWRFDNYKSTPFISENVLGIAVLVPQSLQLQTR